jgi:hypothetical protein
MPVEELSTTLPPGQKVKAPPGVMVGVEGIGFTVTTVVVEVDVHPFALVTATR